MDLIEVSESHQQRSKIRTVLVRCCNHEGLRYQKNYLHPENVYLVKYFPKYYQSLSIDMKSQYSLLSKIKKIKKLKRFAGTVNHQPPQENWFKILSSNRKEIEQIPELHCRQNLQPFTWVDVALNAVKFFFNIAKLQPQEFSCRESHQAIFVRRWLTFTKHLANMRNLKSLEFNAGLIISDLRSFFLEKLNGMPRLLEKLEMLKLLLRSNEPSDILQNKNVLSNLSHLEFIFFRSEKSQIALEISKTCKKLRSFSLISNSFSAQDRNKTDLFQPALLQELPQLQSISIYWSYSWSRDFWQHFIPPASLKRLTLQFNALDMRKALFKKDYDFDEFDFKTLRNLDEYQDFVKHWKNIKELDVLEFQVNCFWGEEMLFMKNLSTTILKKVSRLTSFQCQISLECDIYRYEPFIIEEVPHLYESLKQFQVRFKLSRGAVSFDLGFLNSFKNLKEVEFRGKSCSWANIGDAINLLEKNSEKGEFSTLRLGEAGIYYQEELKDLLNKISKAKQKKTNFKILLGLNFTMEIGNGNGLKFLDQFCEILEAKVIKGLEISLEMKNTFDDIDGVKKILEKYSGMRNLVLRLGYGLEYIKRDGEKEQLLLAG